MLTATALENPDFVVEPQSKVRGIVQRVLWNLQTARTKVERRRGQRHSYPYPLRIWPASKCQMTSDGSILPIGEGAIVMGKHLSTGGLDFYANEPIADRKMVVSLDSEDSLPVQMLVELTWCRFGGHGMYVNGGRFVRALNSRP